MQSNTNQEAREKEEHQNSPHLMIASMTSWLSKPSMVIATFLVLVRMHLLGNGAI